MRLICYDSYNKNSISPTALIACICYGNEFFWLWDRDRIFKYHLVEFWAFRRWLLAGPSRQERGFEPSRQERGFEPGLLRIVIVKGRIVFRQSFLWTLFSFPSVAATLQLVHSFLTFKKNIQWRYSPTGLWPTERPPSVSEASANFCG